MFSQASWLLNFTIRMFVKSAVIDRARSVHPKFQLVRPGIVDHLKRCTRFFETFPVGPTGAPNVNFRKISVRKTI